MRIELHERVHFTKTRSNQGQRCIHCGEIMPEGTCSLSMTKKVVCGNTMNLWCHTGCFIPFTDQVKNNLKKKESEIVSYKV